MVASLIAVLALVGAEEPQVVATAPRGDAAQSAMTAPSTELAQPAQIQTPHGLSTHDQISRWLAARAPDRAEAQTPLWDDVQEPLERKMHGEVSASIGTGGYRDFSAWASMPLGERSELTIGFSQTRNSPWGWGHPYGVYDPSRPYGWGLSGGPRGHGLDAQSGYGAQVGSSVRDSRRRDERPFAAPDLPGRP
jgi:hypothetical protein